MFATDSRSTTGRAEERPAAPTTGVASASWIRRAFARDDRQRAEHFAMLCEQRGRQRGARDEPPGHVAELGLSSSSVGGAARAPSADRAAPRRWMISKCIGHVLIPISLSGAGVSADSPTVPRGSATNLSRHFGLQRAVPRPAYEALPPRAAGTTDMPQTGSPTRSPEAATSMRDSGREPRRFASHQ